MSRFLLIFILLVSLVSCTSINEQFSINSARAIEAEPEDRTPTPQLPLDDQFILDPRPFYVQKPFMCQRGDAFIDVLETRKEYRAFIGQGQLVREDLTKLEVWIFTAVNFQTSTFTIFEWHSKGNIACILAIGKGFEILTSESDATNTFIHVREILTIDN